MRKCGPWREEELLSESAESSWRGDTVIYLTLLFVYGLQSRSAEISRSVGGHSRSGGRFRGGTVGGSQPPSGCFYHIGSTDPDSQDSSL